ncbi:hypothetical protein Pan216_58300 [Planctomycetes bacterium Pan216]|uniref:Uncharacterized protein n=1 Tax=Kolteria novifilia TaxID=2527975 RepID=A0A518BD82_9BACT|nr:hypothetical protein Pan216_58300 [Planctomycetes bacterium Pan216]
MSQRSPRSQVDSRAFRPMMESLEDRVVFDVGGLNSGSTFEGPREEDASVFQQGSNANGAASFNRLFAVTNDVVQLTNKDGTEPSPGNDVAFVNSFFALSGGGDRDAPQTLVGDTSYNAPILGATEVKTLFDQFTFGIGQRMVFAGTQAVDAANNGTASRLWLGVSEGVDPSVVINGSSAPTGEAWHLYEFELELLGLDASEYASLTGLGMSQGELVLTFNIHSRVATTLSDGTAIPVNGLIDSRILIVPKSLVYDGAQVNPDNLITATPGTELYSPREIAGISGQDYWLQPTHNFDSGNTFHIVALNVNEDGELQSANNLTDYAKIYTINTTTPNLQTTTTGLQISEVGDLTDFGEPLNADDGDIDPIQLSMSNSAAVDQSRLAQDIIGTGAGNAVLRDGQIWTTHTVGENGINSEADVRWYQIDASTFQLATIDGTINAGSVNELAIGSAAEFFPQIMVAADGNMAIQFAANPLTRVGAYYTGRMGTDTAGTTVDPITFRTGNADYGPSEGLQTPFYPFDTWGRWTGIAIDPDPNNQPANGTRFWIFGPSADTSPFAVGQWTTGWGSFDITGGASPPPPPGPPPPSGNTTDNPPLLPPYAEEPTLVPTIYDRSGGLHLIIAIDASASMSEFELFPNQDVNYDRVLNELDDRNNDGIRGDDLDYIIALLERSPLPQETISIVIYGSSAVTLAMDPNGSIATGIDDDVDLNGTADWIDVLRSIREGEGGYFDEAHVGTDNTFYTPALQQISSVYQTLIASPGSGGFGFNPGNVSAAMFSDGSGRFILADPDNPTPGEMPILAANIIGPYFNDFDGPVFGYAATVSTGAAGSMVFTTDQQGLVFNNVAVTFPNGGYPQRLSFYNELTQQTEPAPFNLEPGQLTLYQVLTGLFEDGSVANPGESIIFPDLFVTRTFTNRELTNQERWALEGGVAQQSISSAAFLGWWDSRTAEEAAADAAERTSRSEGSNEEVEDETLVVDVSKDSELDYESLDDVFDVI